MADDNARTDDSNDEGEGSILTKPDASDDIKGAKGEGDDKPRLKDSTGKEPAKGDEKPEGKQHGKTGKGDDKPGDDKESKKVAKRPLVSDSTEIDLPDGYELEQDQVDALVDEAIKNGWTEDQLGAFIEFDANRQKRQAEARAAKANETTKEWLEQIAKDNELGGDKIDETISTARNVVRKTIGTQALEALLSRSSFDAPIGNHPELVRLFLRIAPLLEEDHATQSDKGQEAPKKSRAERLLEEWDPKSRTLKKQSAA